MNTGAITRALLVSCAVVAAAACNNGPAPRENSAIPNGTTPRDSAAAPVDQQMPITIAGCLQKGSGGTFLLTEINQQPSQVGTTGSQDAIEHEELRTAEGEYRISPASDIKIDGLVGKQVRVSGTLAAHADLPQEPAPGAQPTASQKSGDTAAPEIKQRELAKVDATAVTMIAESCGTQGRR